MEKKLDKPNIFIVDDDRVSLTILKDSLEKFDFEIFSFDNPEDGINAIIKQDKYNCECLILDLMMPKMNGFEFIEKLQKEMPDNFIPIIISSANQDLESIKKALDLGAYDYFTKPLSQDDLNIFLPKKVRNAVNFFKMQKDVIEKNEKMSKDLNLANQFIIKMFPENDRIKDILYYKYKPYNEIGGDFLDFIGNKDNFIFFLVDISGHGVSAALVASFIKAEFQRYFLQKRDIYGFINYLNIELINLFHDAFFCTIFIAFYDKKDGKLSYINAGHPPPVVFQNDKLILLKGSGSLVGIMENNIYEMKQISVNKNNLMLCYTDGVYEFWLKEKDEIFGINRFYSLVSNIYMKLKKENKINIVNFMDNLYLSIKKYSEGKFSDDLLISLIQL